MQSLDKFRKPPTSKAMGIEIECLVSREIDDPKAKHHGFFYGAYDGSIDYDYTTRAVEFVSQPLTQQWLKREIMRLNKKFNWTHNDTCGIHIHVSRQWLSERKAKTIYTWLQSVRHTDIILELFGRDSNGYCHLGNRYGLTRYNAINNENSATIEFRMFRSGDAAWACYCVDMVEYLINNANRLNIDAVLAFRDSYKL